ncbi:MAG: preprotein translocase subunit SecF [Planctomycetota bacterium]|jgi:preprotein translocase subunit SecF
MFIIRHRQFFISLAIALMVMALSVIVFRGFEVGIDFTGGSVLEVSYESERPDIDVLKESVAGLGLSARVQPFGEHNIIVRSKDLTESERLSLLSALEIEPDTLSIERFNSIGPSIGKELRTKALLAIIIVALAIVMFVAYVFRKVSTPISSWKYGLAAVFALVHDVIVPAGLFALIGGEINTLFVVGLLSILGLSVNDTIVVFDRIRENLENLGSDEKRIAQFDQVVGKSINQTVARSVNTSLTLVVVLVALLIFGPPATIGLALVMLFGTIAGTYSSIFFASPLLVWMSKRIDHSIPKEVPVEVIA